MGLFSKKQTLVTHDGTFHADDIFACATLSLYLKNNIKIIRTRDPKIIEKGDYVFDVGGVYDPEKIVLIIIKKVELVSVKMVYRMLL